MRELCRGFPSFEQVVQLLWADGLGEVSVHAGGEAAVLITLQGVSRQGHNDLVTATNPFVLS